MTTQHIERPLRTMLAPAVVLFVGAVLACGDTGLQRDAEVSDTELQSRVQAQLAREAPEQRGQVQVSSRGGVVTVTGSVASQDEAERIADIIDEVDGVDEVRNQLQVAGARTPSVAAPPPGQSPGGMPGQEGRDPR